MHIISEDIVALDALIQTYVEWGGKTKRPQMVITDWRGVPTWEHDGIICTGETYKQVVKTTFAKGASLADPKSLFNSSLEGSTRRAIDFREGEAIDEAAFRDLVRAAVALNTSRSR